MLHILRHSPNTDSRFASCLRALSPGQSLLLIEESIYAFLPNTGIAQSLRILPGSVHLYALEADLLARGLALDDLPARVTVINYLQMVELCDQHQKVFSW